MRSPTVEIFVDSKCAQYSFSLLNTQRIKSDFMNILLDLTRVLPIMTLMNILL